MLKVGDKVQIKIREKDVNDYRCGFIPEMDFLSGHIFIITQVFLNAKLARPTVIPDDGYNYRLDGEAGSFIWTSGMFTPVGESCMASSQSEETKPKFIDFTRHHRRRYKWNYKC